MVFFFSGSLANAFLGVASIIFFATFFEGPSFTLPAAAAYMRRCCALLLIGIYRFPFRATAALSTRLGYGRPAALARAFAFAFCSGDNAFDAVPFGAAFVQNGLLAFFGIVSSPTLGVTC